MKALIALFLTLTTFQVFASPLPTPDYVDVPRYVGKWYAISSLPQFFTRKCLGQTAEYEVINPQTISVKNTCLKKNNGRTTIFGQAVVKNAQTNAELVVTFNNFFTRLFRVKGDYTIIKLDKNYNYVLVGSKDRKSLWIMSRKTEMPQNIFDEYVKTAKALDFPTENLVNSKF